MAAAGGLPAPLDGITLLDIHLALGEPTVFAIGPTDDDPSCLVEQAVNAALDDALREAEAVLIRRLGMVTLADLAADFDRRFTALGKL